LSPFVGNQNVVIANQVLPSGVQPYVQQQSFGQMIGEVNDANVDWDSESIKVRLNGIVRKIYDRRTWYGLMVRGQIACVGMTIGGTVSMTTGSPTITGDGTNAWTSSVIGMQFRQGYNTPVYSIIGASLNSSPQTLTLELPWAGPPYSSSSYFIAQYYYNLGPNIKYIHTCKNLYMAWRLRLDLNQQSLDAIDPWRINTFMPAALAQMPADPSGNYLVELWPVSSVVMGMPFIACVQPPNLVSDSDSLPPYIRTDIVTKLGRADALVHKGPKLNKYYDAQESQRLRGEAEAELLQLALADENLYRQNLQYEWEQIKYAPLPGLLPINHAVTAANAMDWGGD
jgi:hypothetical protein